MTDEYIRKQDAVKASLEFTVEYLGGAFNEGLQKELKTNLESIEPADVVPVVRCKDCKYHAYDEIFSCYWCEYPGRVRNTTPDGFCEKGEE